MRAAANNYLEATLSAEKACRTPAEVDLIQGPKVSLALHGINARLILLAGGTVTHCLAMGEDVRVGMGVKAKASVGKGFQSASIDILEKHFEGVECFQCPHPGYLFRIYNQVGCC